MLDLKAMQEGTIIEFERWSLGTCSPLTKHLSSLKWIYKVKLVVIRRVIHSVARLEAIRICLAFAAHMKHDITNGCERLDSEMLKKALYGLKQAPRAWYDMLSSFLLSNDFSKGSVDPTLFIRREGNDLILISQSPRGIFINQSKYALESLKKYGYETCDPVDTPMVEKSKLDEDKEGKAVDPSHYHADHAGCQDTRRSTSGSIQLLGDRLVSWSSKRQKSAAISRTES
ncbi:retrovirus-related pol polyprotein from transposon TNT 1-94 [Tanacetum coccineum]|uniref:Retrovirus-related pol polyprotein from transposon TNT 1-94 n=1 Tax=Tanacetum coccineum TaxID=301880 RepID=A0ABQ5JEZ2_9ASTR